MTLPPGTAWLTLNSPVRDDEAENLQTDRPLRAYVILKGSQRSVATGAQVTAASAHQYVAAKEVRQRVRDILIKLGFTVRRVSPMSITVEGHPECFSRVFQARVGHHENGAAPKTASRVSRRRPGTQAPLWAEPPTIPESLRNDVDAVVFPQPVEHHSATSVVSEDR